MVRNQRRKQIWWRQNETAFASSSADALGACDGGATVPDATEDLDLKALSKVQLDLVGDIADTIIPDTDTPGAKSVNVHYLVDELAANWMTVEERTGFLTDLTALDERIKKEKGNSFSKLDAAGRGQVLDQLGEEMIAVGQGRVGLGDITNSDDNNGRKHIYRELRELIIFGYYTSEVGASEELAYDPIPGAYHGCVPFSDLGKAWST